MTLKTSENFITGAVIGGLFGATLALLLTPIPGKKMREKLHNGIDYINKHRPKPTMRRTRRRVNVRVTRVHAHR